MHAIRGARLTWSARPTLCLINALLDHDPKSGVSPTRGCGRSRPRQPFTHSQVMAWVLSTGRSQDRRIFRSLADLSSMEALRPKFTMTSAQMRTTRNAVRRPVLCSSTFDASFLMNAPVRFPCPMTDPRMGRGRGSDRVAISRPTVRSSAPIPDRSRWACPGLRRVFRHVLLARRLPINVRGRTASAPAFQKAYGIWQ